MMVPGAMVHLITRVLTIKTKKRSNYSNSRIAGRNFRGSRFHDGMPGWTSVTDPGFKR